MRYACKKDLTHKVIQEILEKSCKFTHVIDTSKFGDGFPDIMLIKNVEWKPSMIYFVECKTGKSKLMEKQLEFAAMVSGWNYFKLSSIDEALKFIEKF